MMLVSDGKYLVNDVGKISPQPKKPGRPCALLAALSQLRAALAQQPRGLPDDIDEKWRDVHGCYNNPLFDLFGKIRENLQYWQNRF